ncbi:hypothetical protein ACQKIK_03155 [Pseudomonas sp. NPDC047961]
MDITQHTNLTKIFDPKCCFVCGEELHEKQDNYSQEHVFPKWLLNKFSLWNESIILLNGSRIRYKDIKIPCCKLCNNVHLSSIELEVKNSFTDGYEAFCKLDKGRLALWLIKIYLGMLRKETALNLNRSFPGSRNILEPDELFPYRVLQAILKGVSKPIDFRCNSSEVPASIFIYKVKDGTGPDFNYFDTWSSMCLKLKIGQIGLLAVFDMGVLSEVYSSLFSKYEAYELHYQQYLELVARAVERSLAYSHAPFCSIDDRADGITVTVESSYLSSGFYRFDDFSCEELASAFEALGGNRASIYSEEGWGLTSLVSDSGEFRVLD